jgi:hypothetical protein
MLYYVDLSDARKFYARAPFDAVFLHCMPMNAWVEAPTSCAEELYCITEAPPSELC